MQNETPNLANTTIFSDPKKLIALVIPYLVLCGGLYHIAYWNTFDVNGLALISLTDIVKSAVPQLGYFVIIIGVAFLINWVFNFHVNRNFDEPKVIRVPNDSKLSTIGLIILISFFIIGTTTFFFMNYYYRWLWLGLSWLITLPYLISEHTRVKYYIKDVGVRIFVTMLVVGLPIFSFTYGKYISKRIFLNKEYQYIISKEIRANLIKTFNPSDVNRISDTIKYLGITDNYIVLSDLYNVKTIYIRNSKVDTLILSSNFYMR